MAGKLYLAPTPIGNLGDISRRAVETLEAADFIAAEDTRVTVKLLNHLELKKPMVAYHRHNCDTAGPAILRRLEDGESCALVTDAGTPAISDPGEDLVALCTAGAVAGKLYLDRNDSSRTTPASRPQEDKPARRKKEHPYE